MFKKKLHHEENKTRFMILALAISNLIIFSLVEGIIDFEVVNMFKSVVSLKPNPAAVVLDDTCPSLNHYIKVLRCCLWLLFLWIMNHMVEGKILSLFRTL